MNLAIRNAEDDVWILNLREAGVVQAARSYR